MTALFISRESLLVWWRARSRGREAHGAGKMLILYLIFAAICGSPLIFVWRFYLLLPIGLIGVALLLINGKQATQLEERSIAGELLAICGLTLTAPAAYYVASGQGDKTAYWLWALSVFYFASSIFYIKLRIYRLNPRKREQQRTAWQSCAFYHSILLLALAILILSGNLGIFALVAFIPVLIRTFWSLSKPVQQVNLTRAGILEIAYSIVFLIFVALNFRAA
jgi:hypothetical protein